MLDEKPSVYIVYTSKQGKDYKFKVFLLSIISHRNKNRQSFF